MNHPQSGAARFRVAGIFFQFRIDEMVHPIRMAIAVLLAFCSLAVHAQHSELDPAIAIQNPPIPTVMFKFALEGGDPSQYAIIIESTGDAQYHSDGPIQEIVDYRTPSGAPAGDPFHMRFTVSKPTRDHLFALAEKLKYFRGDYDYKKGKIANTGVKTLVYADAKQHNETTYNWSQDERIEELTKLFQDISATMEHGRHLQYMYRHSKLGLDGELKSMEEAAHQNSLAEVQALVPILTTIAKDTTVMHIARSRAQRLLDKLGQAVGPDGSE
jgi:hypothetical protein